MNREYLELWDEFLKLLTKEKISLQTFCDRYHEEAGNELPEYEPEQFYSRMKKLKDRRNETKRPRMSTVEELEKFINFLGKERAPFKLFPQQKIGNWITRA